MVAGEKRRGAPAVTGVAGRRAAWPLPVPLPAGGRPALRDGARPPEPGLADGGRRTAEGGRWPGCGGRGPDPDLCPGGF